jgi:hypothetical protein
MWGILGLRFPTSPALTPVIAVQTGTSFVFVGWSVQGQNLASMWQPLVLSLLGTLAGSGLVVLAARKWIEAQFEKALTEHKAKLDRENALELTAHKAQVEHIYNEKLATHSADLDRANELAVTEFKYKLELAATERNFRFSHVFEKTANAIEELHKRLIELNIKVNSYIIFCGAEPEPEIALQKKAQMDVEMYWTEFSQFFMENRIFIPKTTANQIRAFTRKLSACKQMHDWIRDYRKKDTADYDVFTKRNEELRSIVGDIPPLLEALEDDFQGILGFPDPKGELLKEKSHQE